MDFAEFLEQWLAAQSWSQGRLSDETGISQGLISKWIHADPARRSVPGPKNLERTLRGVEGGALFVDERGRRLTPQRLRAIFAALGRTENVANPIPHRARHTHATELLAEMPGAEIHLRHRLGHVDDETLRDYVTISDPMARQVAEVASLSEKWGL